MTAISDGPADDFDLATTLAPFTASAGLLVAVSGGPDSMALLRLVAGWAERHTHPPIHVATVDHGLRADSRAEAEAVAGWAAAIGLSHCILTWTGEKPTTRIQERARNARYALLARHAETIGADVLMTAHHADDQAETILFRLLRGSHVGGLAGMADVSRRGALVHARPLLGWSKVDLVAVCDVAGQPYFRDPSNADARYARTRMRRLTAVLEAEGLGRNAFQRFGRRFARVEAALAGTAAAARGGLNAACTATSFAVQGQELANLADEIILRILLAEMARIAPGRQAPRLERAETLLSRLLPALRRGELFAATLGGTRIRIARGYVRIDAERPRRASTPEGKRQSDGLAERKCEPSHHEDQRFPWQGTLLGLN